MNKFTVQLLLADNDIDDCNFFREALAELPVSTTLQTVHDGVELMHILTSETTDLPDALFLDLNMPLKTGFECLIEIKKHDKLKMLPVIIFSTSYNEDIAYQLYDSGAHHYIRKPGDFVNLKKVIYTAIQLTSVKHPARPTKKEFVIQI